jgi:cobalamin biosynthesis protein CobT
MNVIEHLFDIAAEEAAELSRGLIRVNRFGLDSVHPRTERKASEEVVHQINDILAVIELMKDRGVVFDNIGDPTAIGEAKKKIVENMEVSYEAGLITLPNEEDEVEAEEEVAEEESSEEETGEDNSEEESDNEGSEEDTDSEEEEEEEI